MIRTDKYRASIRDSRAVYFNGEKAPRRGVIA